MTSSIPKLIAEKASILEQCGIDAARAEVEWVLCHVLDLDRLNLYMHGSQLITPEVLRRVDEIIARRATRYPLQYILEESWFHGRRFLVTPAVMVPTPETELLCERALGFVRSRELVSPRILDLGVGSGVIAVTIAAELERCFVVALDISEEAINVARQNAEHHESADKIQFRRSDLFSALVPGEQFDLILSNPPYIREPDYTGLSPEVKADPKRALVAGEDGLEIIKEIIRQGPQFLSEGGRLMFEIGFDQDEAVAELTQNDARYESLDIVKDLSGIGRVVILGCGQ